MKKHLPFAIALSFMFGLGMLFGGDDPTVAVSKEEPSKDRSVSVFDRIEVKEIVFRDHKDKPRAEIKIDESNTLRFSASSASRPDAFVLSVFDDGRVALLLRDAQGRNRVTLRVDAEGRPAVVLSENGNLIVQDDKNRNRAVLGQAGEEPPKLVLFDEKMQTTVLSVKEQE